MTLSESGYSPHVTIPAPEGEHCVLYVHENNGDTVHLFFL